MDPLEYFSPFLGMSDMIFDNFSVKDLLNLSLVSPSWHEHIAKSPKLMRKVKLSFTCGINLFLNVQEVVPLMENSVRRYQNIKLGSEHREIFNIPFHFWKVLLAARREWKEVELQHLCIDKPEKFLSFVASINRSVELLSLKQIMIMEINSNTRFPILSFPKLKTLMLTDMRQYNVLRLFNRCTSVESFHCSNIEPTIGAFRRFEIFQRNRELKHLHLHANCLHMMALPGAMRLNLKSFSLDCFGFRLPHHSPLHMFLANQSRNLESISLMGWLNAETMALLFHFPNLKSIKIIDPSTNIDWELVEFNKSVSIVSLEFVSKNPSLGFFKSFLNSAPNVVRMKFHTPDEQAIIRFVRNSKRNFEFIVGPEHEYNLLRNIQQRLRKLAVRACSLTCFKLFNLIS